MDEKFRAEARRAGAVNPILRVSAPEQSGYVPHTLDAYSSTFYWLDLRTHDLISLNLAGRVVVWLKNPESEILLSRCWMSTPEAQIDRIMEPEFHVKKAYDKLRQWAQARGGWIDETLDDLVKISKREAKTKQILEKAKEENPVDW